MSGDAKSAPNGSRRSSLAPIVYAIEFSRGRCGGIPCESDEAKIGFSIVGTEPAILTAAEIEKVILIDRSMKGLTLWIEGEARSSMTRDSMWHIANYRWPSVVS